MSEDKEKSYINDPMIRFFHDLYKVRENQRLVVILSHGFLELLINTLIDANCKNAKKIFSSNRDYPHSAKLLVLNEKGIISDDLYKIFDWFRKIRNKAAHDPFFEITKSDLSILKNKKYHNPSNFYELCNDLLSGFWNTHLKTFGPIFAPNLFKNKTDGKNKA